MEKGKYETRSKSKCERNKRGKRGKMSRKTRGGWKGQAEGPKKKEE